MERPDDVVQEGDTIIVKMHDEVDTMIRVISSVEQKIGKGRVNVAPLVGAPFGSIFEIRGRKLLDVSRLSMSEIEGLSVLECNYIHLIFQKDFSLQPSQISGDNRSFTDTNTAQKLTDADITRLRSTGASATDIINSLISNSETWNNKTEFSQEKWLMRKQKKYQPIIQVQYLTDFFC